MRISAFACFAAFTMAAVSPAAEYLVKLHNPSEAGQTEFRKSHPGLLEEVSKVGNVFKWTTVQTINVDRFNDAQVELIQANHVIRLLPNPSIEANRDAILKAISEGRIVDNGEVRADNPDIQNPPTQNSGKDSLLDKCWGIFSSNANLAWDKTPAGKDIVVAVTDTGVDYNHEDLIANMWRNPKEIPNNGIDDDNNGYVDDLVGYDFAANDNKPYDMTKSMFEILLGGGNPGHGTHVSGVIAARFNNGVGVAGVAHNAKIMAMRFIDESGKGDTANAIKAIDYAVANGANIINASWGSQGEEEGDKVLRDAIQRAEKKGVIFVAAAGNGRASAGGTAAGYDNDNDDKPSYPATYPYANVISVAAMDSDANLAKFSNWGKKSVKLGAPGVKIMSTVPGSKYQDTVIDLGGLKVTWDGTSMAAPFVSGALAVIWSQSKNQTWEQVRDKLLASVTPASALAGKTVTEGKLELKSMGN